MPPLQTNLPCQASSKNQNIGTNGSYCWLASELLAGQCIPASGSCKLTIVLAEAPDKGVARAVASLLSAAPSRLSSKSCSAFPGHARFPRPFNRSTAWSCRDGHQSACKQAVFHAVSFNRDSKSGQTSYLLSQGGWQPCPGRLACPAPHTCAGPLSEGRSQCALPPWPPSPHLPPACNHDPSNSAPLQPMLVTASPALTVSKTGPKHLVQNMIRSP